MHHKNNEQNKITYSDELEYLLVTIRGPWNLDFLEKHIVEIQHRLAQLGYKHVLIDNRELIHPGPSSFERYKLGEIIAREWGPYIKAAVITKPENMSGYTETIAANRGGIFMVFEDMETAKAWLRR